ncbi:MAG: hypothetical protein JXK93_11045 [Sphaerochaetaceae bacterium]|nr:hypothetical protein [Sphaerochaetaceae bacterium]
MEKRNQNGLKRRYLVFSLTIAALAYLAMSFLMPIDKRSLVDLLIPSTTHTYEQTIEYYRTEPSTTVYLQFIMDTLFVFSFYPAMALLTRLPIKRILFTVAGAGDMVENAVALSRYLTGSFVPFSPLWTNLKWLALCMLVILYLRGGVVTLLNLSKHEE